MQHWLSSHYFQDLIQNFLKNSTILPQKLKEMAQKLKFPVVLTNLIYWKIAQTKSLQPAVFPSFFADFSSYTTFSNHPSSPLVTFLPILNHDSIFAQQRQCLFFREKVHQSPIVLPFNPSFSPLARPRFPISFDASISLIYWVLLSHHIAQIKKNLLIFIRENIFEF